MAITLQISIVHGDVQIEMQGSETNREEHYGLLHGLHLAQKEVLEKIFEGEGIDISGLERRSS